MPDTRVGQLAAPSHGEAAVLWWPPLLAGTLVRRYKRFLADVRLGDGSVLTAHCPNSGSMAECCEPGRTVYLSRHDNPRRRCTYTWEMIEMPSSLVGVNTLVPNRLVKAAIGAGVVPELAGFQRIRTEVPYAENSRIDILLEKGAERCFVEVKNCTLVREGVARFPDAVTARGLKHLVALQEQVNRGHRAVLLCLVQRMDAVLFRPADEIDPAYGRELRGAISKGVEFLVYDVRLDERMIRLNKALSYEI